MCFKPKLHRQAREILHSAQKVIHYRRDVIGDEAVAAIKAACLDLNRAMHQEKPEAKGIQTAMRRLDDALRRFGGRIYPSGFFSENIEVIAVAAIIALGLRSFFFQPFKIPTNSMWPTYAGRKAHVYSNSTSAPSLPKRAFNFLAYGAKHYQLKAPASGELMIPVEISGVGGDAAEVKLWSSLDPRRRFGIFQTLKARHIFVVGSEKFDTLVPFDFDLAPALLQRFFPKFRNLNELWHQLGQHEKIVASDLPPAGNGNQVYYLKTGIHFQKADVLLSFDIRAGDMLFVDKISYHFMRPKIGAPIVFRTDKIPGLRYPPKDLNGPWLPNESYYIKRLVGQSGDSISVFEYRLYRNGEAAEGAEVFEKNALREDGYSGYFPMWRLKDGGVDKVPEACFYAMGDNSPMSYDSRGWGFDQFGQYQERRTPEELKLGIAVNAVPKKEVVGKVFSVFYPFTKRWGWAR